MTQKILPFALLIIFCFAPRFLFSQCTCVSNQCGDLNVSIKPDGGPTFCEGETITLTNNSDPGFNFFIVDWGLFGPRDTVYDYESLSHQYNIPFEGECGIGSAVFSICYVGVKICEEGVSCQSSTIDFAIKLKPVARFSTNDPVCAGEPFDIKNLSCYGEAYEWDFGDGNFSTDESPSHIYQEPGAYTIKLKVINECGMHETTRQITVLGAPDPDIEIQAEAPYCTPQTITFIDRSNEWGDTFWRIEPEDTVAGVVNWFFQDTSMNVYSDTIAINFIEPADYKVTLVQINPCKRDSVVEMIAVLETPRYNLSDLPNTFCDMATITQADLNFSASGDFTQICWEFVNGSPPSSCGETFSADFLRSGQIIMTLESECGDRTDTVGVTVAQTTPINFLDQSLEFCQDESPINLMDYVTPRSGKWSGPGVERDSFLNTSNLRANTYSYIYSLSDNPDCPNQETLQITIKDSLSVFLPSEPFSCDELTYVPKPRYNGEINAYFWEIDTSGIGANIISSNEPVPPPVVFSKSGTVKVTVEGDCSAKTAEISISVFDTDEVVFENPPSSLCPNDAPITLKASPSGGEWTASGAAAGAISADSLFNPLDLPADVYTIEYNTEKVAPDCPTSASFDLEILESVSVELDEYVGEPCDSLEINLCDFVRYTGIIDSYSWSIEGASPASPDEECPGIVNIYARDSPVQISIAAGGRCGLDSAAVEIPIGSTQPIAFDSFPAQLCQNSEPITLKAQPTGSWSGPEIKPSGFLDPSLLSKGVHEFTYTTTGFQCSTSAAIQIEILEGLFVDLMEVDPTCDTLNLTPEVNYIGAPDTYSWSFPNATPAASDTAFPSGIAFGPDTVYVSLKIEDDVCPAASDSVLIVVEDNVDLVIDEIDQPLCSGSSPIDLNANFNDGVWSGEGVSQEGIFDPGEVSDPNASYQVMYTLTGAVCTTQTSIDLQVVESPEVSLEDELLCQDGEAISLRASPFDSTGVFTGPGIIDDTLGFFDPTEVRPDSIYKIIYSYTDENACEAVASGEVVVEAFPVQHFTPELELCLSNITVNLADLSGYSVSPGSGKTVWKGPGVVDSLNGNFNPLQNGLEIGDYTVFISYRRNKCLVEDSLTIKLIQAESLVLSAPEDTVCIADERLTLSTNLTPGKWSGSGIDSTSGAINLEAAGGGEHIYFFIFGKGTSCEQKDSLTIKIEDPQSEVEAGDDIEICEGPGLYQLPAGIPNGIGYWQGDGIADTFQGIIDLSQLQVGAPYTYRYCFETPTLPGCLACDSLQFTILPRPIADFEIEGRTCIDEIFCLKNLTIDGLSYEWGFGAGVESVAEAPCHSYQNRGNYAITLVATAANQCKDTLRKNLFVSEPPSVDFTLLDREGCAPFKVKVENNSFGDSITQTWRIAGQTISGSELNGLVLDNIVKDSVFIIELEVSNQCDTVRQVDSILVHPYPIANFGMEFDEGCSPLEVSFIDVTLGQPDTNYWDMGNMNEYLNIGLSDPNIPPNQIYYTSNTESTTYEITLIASNFCGRDTLQQSVTVDPPEVKAFIQQDTLVGCQPFEASLLSTSTPGAIITWEVLWQEGNYRLGSNEINPTFTLDSVGTYMAILYAASNCDQDTDTAYIEVKPAPEVSFEIPPFACDGTAVNFINTSKKIGGSLWDFGDMNRSADTSPDHIYDSAGIYQISLTARSLIDNCPATFVDSIRIEENPTAGFAVDTTAGCLPLRLQFTDESIDAISWSWNFGDSAPGSIMEDPIHTFMETGHYVVKQVVRDEYNCVSDTATVNIFVNEHPESSFTFAEMNYCEDYDSLCLINTSRGALVYEWAVFGETYSDINPCILPQTAVENDSIRLIATNIDGCRDTSFRLISILPSPLAAATALPAIGCEDLLVEFSNASKNADINIWDFGDRNPSTDVNPRHLYTEPGNYKVELVARNLNGCPSDTIRLEVEVLEKPVADFSFEKLQTCGLPAEIVFENASDGNADNYWDFGDTTISDEAAPVHTYYTDGTKIITLIIANELGCRDTITKNIEILNQPEANLSIDRHEGCEDLTVAIYNTSSKELDVEWRIESVGVFFNRDSISFILKDPGSYNVGLIARYTEQCTDTIFLEDAIQVYESPIADFDYESDFLEEIIGEVAFENLSRLSDHFEWDFGDGVLSNEFAPYHEYDTNRYVQVLLKAYNLNGGAYTCVDTISKFIDPGLIKTFFAPTALTPDYGPQAIRVFQPVGIGIQNYTIDIYSPYGNLVWHNEALKGDNPIGSWDGNFKGKPVDAGAYVWVARIVYFDGAKDLKKGTVTVIR